jgi:SAM-dependent methyltransferase
VVQLSLDEETRKFLESCRPRWFVDAAAGLLRSCLSVTDINGLLGRGQMFVLSGEQAEALLGAPLAAARAAHAGVPLRLLDVGAGDGEVTARLARLFDSVTATEVSRVMCHRLSRRGFSVKHTARISADVFPEDGAFDVVACMNLLDRCDFPLEMLRDAARLTRRGTGRLLLAVVLPFSEFVEEGAGRRAVRGALPMKGARCSDGATLEASLAALVERVLRPLGLEIERVSRVPYLCRGDSAQPFYVLSDAVLLLRHGEEGAAGGGGVWDGTVGKAQAQALEACDAVLLPQASGIRIVQRK